MRSNSNRMFSMFRRADGAQFLAFLSTTAATPTKDQMPYRQLIVKSSGIVGLGDVVTSPAGRKILLLETPSDNEWGECYRAAFVSREHSWTRRVVVTDPVSKVKRDNGTQDMGTICVYIEHPQISKFEGESDTKYKFVTGEDVQPGDKVDGKIVKRIWDSMGARGVEIE